MAEINGSVKAFDRTKAGKEKMRVAVIQAVVFCVVIAAVWGLVVAIEVIYNLPQVIMMEQSVILPAYGCFSHYYNTSALENSEVPK